MNVPNLPVIPTAIGAMTDSEAIIARNLTGQETAAELQRLAEVFEVREALRVAPCVVCGATCTCWGIAECREETLAPMCDEHCGHGGEDGWCTKAGPRFDEDMQRTAERLHAAGWRPGDSAERAAELLTGKVRV